MRRIVIAIAVLMSVSAAQAQSGFDRRGGDYSSAPATSGDPAECAERCEQDSKCRAWSFSYPATARTRATCWLKNRVTPPQQDNCCVSGVRGSAVIEPREVETEFSIDRVGGDYRDFVVTVDPRGAACRSACEGDNKCRAWTYVRPGYIGVVPRCYLKSEIKPPRRKPCCISGVVR
jgi:hypothetical protein